jgi:hypothetical protein
VDDAFVVAVMKGGADVTEKFYNERFWERIDISFGFDEGCKLLFKRSKDTQFKDTDRSLFSLKLINCPDHIRMINHPQNARLIQRSLPPIHSFDQPPIHVKPCKTRPLHQTHSFPQPPPIHILHLKIRLIFVHRLPKHHLFLAGEGRYGVEGFEEGGGGGSGVGVCGGHLGSGGFKQLF